MGSAMDHGTRPRRWLFASLLASLALSCGGDEPSGQPSASALYGPSIQRIALEVDYVRGFEPATGDAWRLFSTNAQRLFQGANKTFEIPTALSQMQAITITEGTGQDYTTDRVMAVARAHRDRPSEGATATFYVVWLDGYYHDGTQRRTDVLGASFGTTGVIAMFKPVINASVSGTRVNLLRFVEQSTLVHEFGHAVGLVDHGVPLTSAHLDSAHGAHCTNTACTMYYANEGARDAVEFASRYAQTGDAVLFGEECLRDTAAQIASAR